MVPVLFRKRSIPMLVIEFAAASLPQDGALVLLVMEGAELAGLGKAADEACGAR